MTKALEIPGSFLAFAPWRTLRVYGPDAATWLHGIVTCDVLAARPDRAIWGSLLTKQGKVEADLQIMGAPDEIFIAVCGGDHEKVYADLERYLVMEEAEIEMSGLSWLVAHGERAHEELSKEGLTAARVSWASESTSVAIAEHAEREGIRSKCHDLVLDEAGFSAWLTMMGIPQFGLDYDFHDNLHAASLERRTVDWSKGCYLGQEVVCMQDMRGKVKRRLVGLDADSSALASGLELRAASTGEVVGRVTSGFGHHGIGSVTAPYFEADSKLLAGKAAVTVRLLC